jgi:hypothetical protein
LKLNTTKIDIFYDTAPVCRQFCQSCQLAAGSDFPKFAAFECRASQGLGNKTQALGVWPGVSQEFTNTGRVSLH